MVMWDHEPMVFNDLMTIILPTKFQYLTAGLSSIINSSWGGLAVAEYWPRINGSLTLQVHVGIMKLITSNVANGHTVIAARASSASLCYCSDNIWNNINKRSDGSG